MFDFCDLRVTESIGCQTGDFSPIVSFRKVSLFSLLLRFYCFLLLHFIHLVVDLCCATSLSGGMWYLRTWNWFFPRERFWIRVLFLNLLHGNLSQAAKEFHIDRSTCFCFHYPIKNVELSHLRRFLENKSQLSHFPLWEVCWSFHSWKPESRTYVIHTSWGYCWDVTPLVSCLYLYDFFLVRNRCITDVYDIPSITYEVHFIRSSLSGFPRLGVAYCRFSSWTCPLIPISSLLCPRKGSEYDTIKGCKNIFEGYTNPPRQKCKDPSRDRSNNICIESSDWRLDV